MSSWWLPVVSGGATGLGSGALAAWLTPWGQWVFLEKKRLKHEGRVSRLAEWRAGIAALDAQLLKYRQLNLASREPATGVEDWKVEYAYDQIQYSLELQNQAWFQSLSHHLDADTDAKVRNPKDHYLRTLPSGKTTPLSVDKLARKQVELLSAAVARVEREWGLAS